ncbi:MFS general substrate transporter [Viridothelium virens]|uniref:MFS general substrate transporter n=1 Tax=Viridothelium virens TaxID=1048519 RepID=A0A6A6GXR3_VIRVR|nr:MFS general substrate transporter [Viridothelium virens]
METTPQNAKANAPAMEEARGPAMKDGGLFAWLQCAGAFLMFFNSWGLVNSFGAFQTFYEQNLLTRQSPSQIAWIGSLQAFLFIIGGTVAGPLYDHGRLQTLVRSGSFLVVFGMMMTSLGTKYWHLILAQGLTVGIGSAALFVPSIALLPPYFIKRRALATGTAVTGSNLGGVVYAIMFSKLQPRIGFPWTTRVMGFVMLATLSLPLTSLRMRFKPATARKVFDPKPWTELPFAIFAFACFVGFSGLYVPYFYIESFVLQKNIFSVRVAFYVVPILNAGAFIGRLLLSFLADYAGPVNILLISAFACAVLGYVWAAITSPAAIIVFAILFGAFSGTYISVALTTIAVWLCPEISALGLRIGMMCIPCAAGLLIGSPVGGVIAKNDWLGVQMFTGSTLLASTIAVAAVRTMKSGWSIARKC